MLLKVIDRLMMSNKILREETSLLGGAIAEELQAKIAFTPEELAKFGIVKNGPNIIWDPVVDTGVEFDFTAAELTLMRQQVNKMDLGERIPPDARPVCMAIKETKEKAP
jgi:hypothetical protein